jgi:hypothetical protein
MPIDKKSLTNLFGYFKDMNGCHSKLRYFDWDGQVHLAKGKTGGQQGEMLKMLIPIAPFYHWIPETRNLRRFLVYGIQW